MRIFLKKDSTLPILLVVNSPGGEITAAIRVCLKVANAPCPIEVHCVAAQGVATLIVASGTKGRRFGYSFSRIGPQISSKEIDEDPNLVPFLEELIEDGWFQPESLCHNFALSADIAVLAKTKSERQMVWQIVTRHYSSPKILFVRRLLKDLSYEERNHFLILKLFIGLLSMFTGMEEKISYEFTQGIWEVPSRFGHPGSRKIPLSLPPEDALSIGLFDQIRLM